jgi:hypothetical protein
MATDTSREAHHVQTAIWRRLGPSGRVALAVAMSEDLREVTRAGVRQRHPDYSDHDVELALRHLIWGAELFSKVYPDTPAPRP